MKKFLLPLIVVVAVFIVVFVGFTNNSGSADSANEDYLRIHIRANSNSIDDQNVKYLVKDAVVTALTPIVASSKTFEEAKAAVNRSLKQVSEAAEKTLKTNGFCYGARAEIKSEYFPTRDYGGETFASGVYDALIVYLGDGTGDNWWCVVYPPLCFVNAKGTDSDGITYKSKIVEIIKNWKK